MELLEIGKTHNEILAYYSAKAPSEFSYTEAISIIEGYLVTVNNYNEGVVKESTQKIIATKEFELMSRSKSTAEEIDFNTYLEAVVKYFHPSEQLTNALRIAFSLGESDPDQLKDFVVKNIQEKTWKGCDRDLAYIFSDVLLNSYEYWTTPQITKRPLKKSSKVILYDAGGAIHGFIFGPIGSIIEGALLSVAANETLPEDE